MKHPMQLFKSKKSARSFNNRKVEKEPGINGAPATYRLYRYGWFFGWRWFLLERTNDEGVLDHWAEWYNCPQIKKLKEIWDF